MPPPLIASDGFNMLVRGRHGMVLFNRNDTVVGRSIATYGEYFESEVEVFRRMVRPAAHVADIGANIGTHTLALAAIVGAAGWVYAFEPQRLVFQTLCANVALNSLENVDCEPLALADRAGQIAVEELDPHASNNFGGLPLGSSAANRSVRTLTLDAYLGGRRLDFAKIDIQGMEEACLRGARDTLRQHRTVLYVENDQPEKSPALLAYLHGIDYATYWHLPPFFNPANMAGTAEIIHPVGYIDTDGPFLLCNGFAINMLCVPRSLGARINGLLEAIDINEHPLTRGANRFHPAIG